MIRRRHPRSEALLALLVTMVLASASARAGGFEIDEQSPAGTAMAGAMTALSTDASTLFYNPAGLALQVGGSALLGGTLVLASARVATPDGTVSDTSSGRRAPVGLPTAYVSTPVGKRFAAGIGVFSQLSSSVDFEGGTRGGVMVPFPGRFIGTRTELRTITVNPTVALLVIDGVAIGAGVDVVAASADLRRQLRVGGGEVGAHEVGAARAIGWNVGVQARIVPERLTVGLAWRSGVELPFELRAHFDPPAELIGVLRDQPARGSLSLPHNLSVGVAVHPSRATTLTADLRLALWSDTGELRTTQVAPGGPGGTGALPELVVAERWKDAVSLRLGFEWLVRTAPGGLALRLGLGYDQSPVPADTLGPIAPDSDRWLLSAGLGYTLSSTPARGLGVSVGYLAAIGRERTSSNPELPGAAWRQSAHLMTAALSYRWGSREKLADGAPSP